MKKKNILRNLLLRHDSRIIETVDSRNSTNKVNFKTVLLPVITGDH